MAHTINLTEFDSEYRKLMALLKKRPYEEVAQIIDSLAEIKAKLELEDMFTKAQEKDEKKGPQALAQRSALAQ